MSEAPANWKYTAEDRSGAVVTGILNAADESSAVESLRDRQLAPITISRAQSARLQRGLFTKEVGILSLPELSLISKRLADLLGAGLPLLKAVEVAHKQAPSDRQSRFYDHIAKEVRAGRSLSAALSNGDLKAPRLMVALVRASENLGALPEQFANLSEHYESALKLRREITAQLVYPFALVVLIILTLIFLSYFVLPQFEVIFENSGARPPLETRIALSMGAFIRANLFLAPIAGVLLLIAGRFLRSHYQTAIENALLNIPYLGRMRRDSEIGRYCRAVSTLLAGGTALSDAMPLAAETVQNDSIRNDLSKTEHAVRTGDKLSAALARFAAPSTEMTSFLEVGDETGELAAMAAQAAKFTEERTRVATKRFMALLGPVLTAIMGLLTAGVIAAVMSGVLSLNDAIY